MSETKMVPALVLMVDPETQAYVWVAAEGGGKLNRYTMAAAVLELHGKVTMNFTQPPPPERSVVELADNEALNQLRRRSGFPPRA